MTSIKIVNAPGSKFFQTSNNKRPGLAVLVVWGVATKETGYFRRMLKERFQWIARAYPQYVAVCTTVDDAIVVCGSSRTNRLAERPNGCGLVVLDVEEAVHLGDLEQVVDPLAEVHHL